MKYRSQQATKFLLLDVLHAGVLAQAKPDWNVQSLWQLVESSCHNLHAEPAVIPPILEKWLLPESLGGEQCLSVFRATILEHLLTTHERLGWQACLTSEVLHMAAPAPLCQELFNHCPVSKWAGALMVPKLEQPEITCTATANPQLVKLHGTHFKAFALNSQFQLFLLLVQREDHQLLVLLPSMRVQDGQLVDNEIKALDDETIGSYALGENSFGFLVGELANFNQRLFSNLNCWADLHALGRTQGIVQKLHALVQDTYPIWQPKYNQNLALQQQWLGVQSLSEALRALVFVQHFYKDCCQWGTNTEAFQQLLEAHQDLGMFYLPEQALKLQGMATQLTQTLMALMGEKHSNLMPENSPLPMQNAVLGWQPHLVQEPATSWIKKPECWQQLLKEFEGLNVITQSGLLKEAYVNFYAVISKAMILVDNWSNQQPPEKWQQLYTKSVSHLFGDLLAAAQLLNQGGAIERYLKSAGLNVNDFYAAALQDKKLQFYYNRLLQIQHFMLTHFAYQHGRIRELERHSDAALALLWDDD